MQRRSTPSRQACFEHHACSGLPSTCGHQTKQHRLYIALSTPMYAADWGSRCTCLCKVCTNHKMLLSAHCLINGEHTVASICHCRCAVGMHMLPCRRPRKRCVSAPLMECFNSFLYLWHTPDTMLWHSACRGVQSQLFRLTWRCIWHCLCLGAKPRVAAVSATLLIVLTPCRTAYKALQTE